MERYVVTGYVKMIAISISGFESIIIDEKNTNYIQDIETFQGKYGHKEDIKCMFLHMIEGRHVDFVDYKKIIPSFHPFDYMRDLVKSHSGNLLEESEDFSIGISDRHHKQKSISDILPADEAE